MFTLNLQLSCAGCHSNLTARWGVGVIVVEPCKRCADRQFSKGYNEGHIDGNKYWREYANNKR